MIKMSFEGIELVKKAFSNIRGWRVVNYKLNDQVKNVDFFFNYEEFYAVINTTNLR